MVKEIEELRTAGANLVIAEEFEAIANLQRATSTTFQLNNIQVVSPVDQK